MNGLLSHMPEIAEASPSEQLAMIDELWELVRRTGEFPVPDSHLAELERRASAVLADPLIALSPKDARALLRR